MRDRCHSPAGQRGTSEAAAPGPLAGAAWPAPCHPRLRSFPDLAGSWSGVALLPGGVASTLTVANQGTDKSKSTPVALYRSADPVWDLGDLPIPAQLEVGSVKPGAARSVEIEVPTFAFASGDYLIAVIDPEKSLDDLDRSDNTLAAQIP